MTSDSTLMAKGTPLYIAPEIWNRNQYTPACDVYAYALIVYEIMTGEDPWENMDCTEIIMKVKSGNRPEIKPYVPESYQNLIKKCWEQDPHKRPTFDDILDELRNDDGFITDSVEKDDYLDYIDFVDNYEKTFRDKSITIDKFIKRALSTFTKVILDSPSSSSHIMNTQKTATISPSKERKRSSLFKHKSKMIFPSHEFKDLDPLRQRMVEESCGDPDEEFKIGVNLIEGKENFPQNTEIGLLYLEHTSKKSIKAAIYYSRLLIKGDKIIRDIEKAKRLLKKLNKEKNGTVLLLRGKIKKIENKHVKAFEYFNKSSKAGCAEGMYEYAKMFLKGLGCEKNALEAKRYFEMSRTNGFAKSLKYIDAKLSALLQRNCR